MCFWIILKTVSLIIIRKLKIGDNKNGNVCIFSVDKIDNLGDNARYNKRRLLGKIRSSFA